MIIKYLKDYIENISEGLIKTYDSNIVLNDFLKTTRDIPVVIKGKADIDTIIIEVFDIKSMAINAIEPLLDHIMIFVVNSGGWFPSKIDMININGLEKSDTFDIDYILSIYKQLEKITITFECKFDEAVKDIPKVLYHLTINEYTKKINRFGIAPKSKSKLSSHLDRVYLCTSIEDCKGLIPKMQLFYSKEKDEQTFNTKKYLLSKHGLVKKDYSPVIYQIDNSDETVTVLYKDPNFINGYYTLSNIPKTKIKRLDIKI